MLVKNIKIKYEEPKQININLGQVIINILSKLVKAIKLNYYGVKLY